MCFLTSLVDLEDALNPGDDLVRRGVRGLVEVDDTVSLELGHGAGSGGPAAGERGEMVSLYVQLVEVLLSRMVRSKPKGGTATL